MLITTILQLLLELDRVKLILSTHHHIEDGDQDCHTTDNHSNEKQSLGFELILGLTEDE